MGYNKGDKLVVRGVATLTDCELLAEILSDAANAESMAEQILHQCDGDMSQLLSGDMNSLRMVDGLGARRASRILAAVELGRRIVSAGGQDVEVRCSEDVVALFRPKVKMLQHEECWALHLNAANRIIEMQRVSQGGVAATVVDIRLIVKRALELLSTNIILVHNHPSGSVAPSQADIDLTHDLRDATALFNITLRDHIIISSESEFSFVGGAML